LSGVAGSSYSVSVCPPFPPSQCAQLVCSITNGSTKTHAAEDTINGYMIFILYSVAFLAGALSYLLSHRQSLTLVVFFFSCSLYRVDDVYGDPPVSRRVRSEGGHETSHHAFSHTTLDYLSNEPGSTNRLHASLVFTYRLRAMHANLAKEREKGS
jgi:hypothetical protein